MGTTELKQALRMISKVLGDPRLKLDQRDQLLRAKRELDAIARSGKLEKRRVFLAVEIVVTILVEMLAETTQRSE